jgi:hypothetical protein
LSIPLFACPNRKLVIKCIHIHVHIQLDTVYSMSSTPACVLYVLHVNSLDTTQIIL